jgi:hypothetical protein
MRITSTGNVGIGVTGPTRKLTIGNANGFINNQISLLDGGGTEQATIAVENYRGKMIFLSQVRQI